MFGLKSALHLPRLICFGVGHGYAALWGRHIQSGKKVVHDRGHAFGFHAAQVAFVKAAGRGCAGDDFVGWKVIYPRVIIHHFARHPAQHRL